MYAIIEDSGSQMKVQQGDVFEIDLRDAKADDEITFDHVLLVGPDEGDAVIGTPYVNGAAVTAKVLCEKKGEKLQIIKYKRRKGYKRKVGHRQPYLTVEVTGITQS
ncbi:MAG: 50S ribosomal protein L21 [Planctomycetes bacterium]|nr:50S ribosomal protein L21 [Planctomycetota bacterium]NOG55795.1 50S ribosomal protein L21 [Planctomycetota bacterium]